MPDIRQSKRLAVLYHMTLDELIEYDFDEQQALQSAAFAGNADAITGGLWLWCYRCRVGIEGYFGSRMERAAIERIL